MSTCPAVGCAAQAKPGMFMCWNHWRRLPKLIRDEVFRAWRAYQAGGGRASLLEHAVICDEAIRWTAEKEGHPPPAVAVQRALRLRTREAPPAAGMITPTVADLGRRVLYVTPHGRSAGVLMDLQGGHIWVLFDGSDYPLKVFSNLEWADGKK